MFAGLILFGLGALLAVIAELPYGGWLQLPILSTVWWRLRLELSQTLKRYFAYGLMFGLGYFLIGLWWLYISMHDVGGMNPVLSSLAVFMLSLYMALYFSVASFSIRHFKQSSINGLLL
ncbi:MAG: apolipoprotein N-acyltransferase, partial [Flavobacteriia bacterium]|nr:apolipoprotein N-acyltransferase [Flavobacteriia bacterium]